MDRDAIADRIIQDHTFYSTVGGALPLPLADIAIVTAIQVDLIRALARVYETPFDVATGKALLTALTGATVARAGASAVKSIPGVGWVTGGIAQAGLAGASTYAVGQLFRGHFAQQGTLADLDPDGSLPLYQSFFERGKEVASSFRGAPSRRPVAEKAETLERLGRLRDQELIDTAEYDQLKADLMAGA